MTLSKDICWRVIWKRLYDGKSPKNIASELLVHLATVYRIMLRFNRGQNPCSVGNQRGRMKNNRIMHSRELLILRDLINENPLRYLDELQREFFHLLRIRISLPTMCRSIKLLGFSRKLLVKNARERCELKRSEFRTFILAQGGWDKYIWFDESHIVRGILL